MNEKTATIIEKIKNGGDLFRLGQEAGNSAPLLREDSGIEKIIATLKEKVGKDRIFFYLGLTPIYSPELVRSFTSASGNQPIYTDIVLLLNEMNIKESEFAEFIEKSKTKEFLEAGNNIDKIDKMALCYVHRVFLGLKNKEVIKKIEGILKSTIGKGVKPQPKDWAAFLWNYKQQQKQRGNDVIPQSAKTEIKEPEKEKQTPSPKEIRTVLKQGTEDSNSKKHKKSKKISELEENVKKLEESVKKWSDKCKRLEQELSDKEMSCILLKQENEQCRQNVNIARKDKKDAEKRLEYEKVTYKEQFKSEYKSCIEKFEDSMRFHLPRMKDTLIYVAEPYKSSIEERLNELETSLQQFTNCSNEETA